MKKERQMSNSMYQKVTSDKNLVLGAKNLFRTLWEYANENWELTLKNKELALITGYSERSISRNIQLLAKHGYIIRNVRLLQKETNVQKRKIKIIKKEL